MKIMASSQGYNPFESSEPDDNCVCQPSESCDVTTQNNDVINNGAVGGDGKDTKPLQNGEDCDNVEEAPDPQKKRESIIRSRTHKFRRQIRRKSSAKDISLSLSGDSAGSETLDNTKENRDRTHDCDDVLHKDTTGETSGHSMDHVDRLGAKQAFAARNMHPSFDKYSTDDTRHDDDDDDGVQEYHLDDADDPSEHRLSTVLDTGQDTVQSKREARIKHICQELLDTEERYVTRLEHLVEIKKKTGRILNEVTARSMFPNVDVICQLHHDFLPSLRFRIHNWKPDSQLGDLMQKMTPFLKLYTEYVKNFKKASELVQLWKGKNVNFNKLLYNYSCKKYGSMDIGGRMIEPVQRVPRYELLLKDYLKRLPEDSTDKENVQNALDKVSEAANHFETMMRRDARIAKMISLQRSLDGAVNIFSFSRELLEDADVTIVNTKLNRSDECSLYLFNDLLLVTRDVHQMGLVRKKVKHLIDLAKVKVTEGSSSLRLVVGTRIRDVEIEFSCMDDVVKWIQDIRHQIAESNKKKLIRRGTWQESSSRKTLGESAPRMVLPHTVSVCMSCGFQFDTQKRKKNCAACGMVVCGKCSPHRMLLDYDRSEPRRVCHNCHTVMNKERTFSL